MAKKLYLLIGLFALSILIIITLSWVAIGKLNELTDEAYTRAEEAEEATSTIAVGPALYRAVADSIIGGNPDASAKDWQEAKELALQQIGADERIVDTDEERLHAKAAHQAYDNFVSIYETEMLPLLRATPRNPAAIAATSNKIGKESQAISEHIKKNKRFPRRRS